MRIKAFVRDGNLEKYTFFDGHELQYDCDTKTLKLLENGKLVWKGNLDSEDDLLSFKRQFYDLVLAVYEEFEGVKTAKLRNELSKIVPKRFEVIKYRPCPCGG
ncbi:MAG: hypothetical protein DRQ10_03545 [Candidatus Hydrothermota bacterium]|nr:MAG: hypothetical protein DRQ10_03545 [Candidatus Hydrothermae bacterium]